MKQKLGIVIIGLVVLYGARVDSSYVPPTAVPFKNWALINTKAQSHIDALEAWKLEKGSKKVVVAVIDTGIDVSHPDLEPNIWHDPEHPDQYGWDFVGNHANPVDDHGHGTHVAGIIGAVTDLKNGTSGVSPIVTLMPIKYFSDANPGSVNLKNTVKAIYFAIDNGAKIINYSGGGPEFSESEYLALKDAERKGILVITAAGNERHNSDLIENYYYPAAYRLSNMISVAASDINNNLLPSSNWGKSKVDVVAPGENIFSTLPGGRFGYMSGTSQATAVVTGVAALILAKNPKLTPAQVRQVIISTVYRTSMIADKTVSGGRVDAYQALLALSHFPR